MVLGGGLEWREIRDYGVLLCRWVSGWCGRVVLIVVVGGASVDEEICLWVGASVDEVICHWAVDGPPSKLIGLDEVSCHWVVYGPPSKRLVVVPQAGIDSGIDVPQSKLWHKPPGCFTPVVDGV